MERILTFCKKMIDETFKEHIMYFWLLINQKKRNRRYHLWYRNCKI